MQEASLAFLIQQQIGSEGKITVPDRVRDLLFENPESGENQYVWNHDKQDGYIIISPDSLREEQSSILLTSPAVKANPKRTVIPKKVRDEFDLKEGDDLYFVTQENLMGGIPAVFVWTFGQIEEKILCGAEESGSEFPRAPNI